MQKTVWCIFVADSHRGFPNFFPIGVYDAKEKALHELEGLPKEEHYQLFEIPLNSLFGVSNGARVESRMGLLYHEHHSPENEFDELGRIIIHSPDEIPKNMTEKEEHEFWKKHAMSEKLLEESFIEEDDPYFPPPRK